MSYWACSEDFLTTIPIAPVTSFPKSTLMLGEDGEKLYEHFKTAIYLPRKLAVTSNLDRSLGE